MPHTCVNPLTLMKSCKSQSPLFWAWHPFDPPSHSATFFQNAKKNPACCPELSWEIAMGTNGSSCLYALCDLNKWQHIITLLSNSHFQVSADSDETTCKTTQLSWTTLFSKHLPKLTPLTKCKTWSDTAAQHTSLLMMKAMNFPWKMDTFSGWRTQSCRSRLERHYYAMLPVYKWATLCID